jgi:hypothetical protein
MGQSESKLELQGGWATVEKTNPELWKRVLNKVHKENPGPWAAWKSMKAVRLYKEMGGKYKK